MRILVAVSAYNEEASICKTLRDLKEHNFGYDIVVFDNGSTDNTAKLVQAMDVEVVIHPINTGSSMGVVTSYYLYAFKKGYDILCQVDGDGQHLAREIYKIVEPVKRGEADYVIGSRFLTNEGFQSSFIRRNCINLFSFLCTVITKTRITDITSGFRAYSKKTIEFYGKNYRKEIFDINHQLLLAALAGAKVCEVPVIMKEREFGVSEFSNIVNALGFPIKGLINIIGSYLQKRVVRKMEGCFQ
jgi:glycosyltransferase involved in cell wall biosynthesis